MVIPLVTFDILFYLFYSEKKKCPKCEYNGTSLPRHLRNVHEYSKGQASSTVSSLMLRKQYTKKVYYSPLKVASKRSNGSTRKWKNYHIGKVCPLPSCSRVVSHVSQHLSGYHKMVKDDRFYSLLKAAKKNTSAEGTKSTAQSSSGKEAYASVEPSKNSKEASLRGSKKVTNTSVEFVKHNINAPTGDSDMLAIHGKKASSGDTKKVSNTSVELVEQHREAPLEEDETVIIQSSDDEMPTCDSEKSSYDGFVGEECAEYIENLLQDCFRFLTGPDRGRKTQSIAEVVNDVRRILNAVGATNDLAIIFDGNCNTLRNEYLMKHCVLRKMKPSSIKKYLYSLIDFCTFLLTEKVNVQNVTPDDILTTKLRLDLWRKSYSSKDRIFQHARNSEDLEMLVTPEQVQKYQESECAKIARQLFADIETSVRQLSQAEYCSMRDHLFTAIHFGCGHRSGVSVNLTMKELSKAKEINDRMVEVKVWEHKTVASYGPAKIVLSLEEYDWLKIFVKHARSQLHEIMSDKVFLSWNGASMKSGDVSKRLHNLWCKVGIFDDRQIPKHLSCNIIRKSTSTGLRESNAGNYQAAADLMAHSIKTANSHYYLREQEKSASIASGTIRKHYYQGGAATPNKRKMWNNEEINELTKSFTADAAVTDVNDQISTLNIDASPKQVYDKIKSLKRYSPEKFVSIRTFQTPTKPAREIFGYMICKNVTIKRVNDMFVHPGLGPFPLFFKKHSKVEARYKLGFVCESEK